MEVNFGNVENKVNEFLAICKAMSCSKDLNVEQMYFLKKWLEEHEEILNIKSISKISDKLGELLVNIAILNSQKDEFINNLNEFSKKTINKELELEIRSNLLPLDDIENGLKMANFGFFLAGDFKHIKENEISSIICQHGGKIYDELDENVDFVVLGLGQRNRDIKHTLNDTLNEIEQKRKNGDTKFKVISETMIITKFE